MKKQEVNTNNKVNIVVDLTDVLRTHSAERADQALRYVAKFLLAGHDVFGSENFPDPYTDHRFKACVDMIEEAVTTVLTNKGIHPSINTKLVECSKRNGWIWGMSLSIGKVELSRNERGFVIRDTPASYASLISG